jgi:hypothetical protein
MDGPELVCGAAHPAIGCGAPEVFTLSVVSFLESVACLVLLVHHCRTRKRAVCLDFYVIFWVATMLWTLLRCTIDTFYFDWTLMSYLLIAVVLDGVGLMISSFLVSMILGEVLHTYKRTKLTFIYFSRYVSAFTVFVFLAVGVAAALAQDSTSEPDSSDPGMTYLWKAGSFFVIAEFVGIPGWELIKALSSPIVQPGDVRFVKWGRIGLIVFVGLNVVRGIYDVTVFIGRDAIVGWMEKDSWYNMSAGDRAFQVLFDLVFCNAVSSLSIIGVVAVREHERQFEDDDFYQDNTRISERLIRQSE